MSVVAKMMVWNWVGVDLNLGFNSFLYPSNAFVSLQMFYKIQNCYNFG